MTKLIKELSDEIIILERKKLKVDSSLEKARTALMSSVEDMSESSEAVAYIRKGRVTSKV